jgi:medium-chain acyl-[acyl-carrier-protein] hydrolase
VSGAWFARYQPVADPALRLVCVPYAGAGAAAYRSWPPLLPARVELWAVEPPGRATRIAEPALGDLALLADELAAAVRAQVAGPFVLFGHSMGALLAFEVCRRLGRAGAPLPRHLVVSARRAPHIAHDRPPIASLPDAELARVLVERYDGVPAPVLREPELMALFLPTLRADIRALEAYRFEPGPPLALPITALAGDRDPNAPVAEVGAWREHTSARFALHTFEGGHFFIHARRAAVIEHLARAALAPPF